MFCMNCGAPMKDGAKFCESCGSEVVNDTSSSVEVNEQKETVSPDPQEVTPSPKKEKKKIRGKRINEGN